LRFQTISFVFDDFYIIARLLLNVNGFYNIKSFNISHQMYSLSLMSIFLFNIYLLNSLITYKQKKQ